MPEYLRAKDGTLYPYHQRFGHMEPATQEDIDRYFGVAAEKEPEQTDRLILRDGTDITTMRAKAMRAYARAQFTPDPAWAGSMRTEEIRQALYELDRNTLTPDVE